MRLKKASTIIIKFISGNALSQLILILGTPFLTRLYTPADFGIYAILLSIILIVGVVGTGRYDQIIYKYMEQVEWNDCFANGLIISFVISSLTLLLTYILCLTLNFSLIYVMLGPLIFSFSVIQLFTSLLSLHSNYRQIIVANFLRSIILVVSQLILYKLSSVGLVIGLLLSQVFTLLYLAFYSLKTNKVVFKLVWKKHNYKELFLSSFQSLSNALSSQLPVLFIPQLYGVGILGLYGLAMRLTQIPITFFTNAIRPYIMGELNKYKNEKQTVFEVLWKSSGVLLILSVIGIAMIYLLAEDFFRIYAGEAWAYAGNIASIISIWLLIAFANVVATSYLTVSARFFSLFVYDIILLLLRGGVVVGGYYMNLSFAEFLLSYSLLGMVFNLGIIIYAIFCGWQNAKNTDCYC